MSRRLPAAAGPSLPLLLFTILLSLILLASCREQPSGTDSITVFAAASTAEMITDLAGRFEAATGVEVKLSFAASSTLARQIAQGAQADVFLSANEQWMDYLQQRDLVEKTTRRDLLTNHLVLVVPAGSPLKLAITETLDLRSMDIQRIAIGDPDHVPAGIYTLQALERLGWTDQLRDLLIPCPDIRAALRLVELREVDLGIVYASDAHNSERVDLIATFPSNLHDPILYPIAAVKDASERAAAFLSFLSQESAAATMKTHGFQPVSPAPADGRIPPSK